MSEPIFEEIGGGRGLGRDATTGGQGAADTVVLDLDEGNATLVCSPTGAGQGNPDELVGAGLETVSVGVESGTIEGSNPTDWKPSSSILVRFNRFGTLPLLLCGFLGWLEA